MKVASKDPAGKGLTFASEVFGEEEAARTHGWCLLEGMHSSDEADTALALADESQKYNRYGERTDRVQFPPGHQGNAELVTLG